jgi:hypothetical protein
VTFPSTRVSVGKLDSCRRRSARGAATGRALGVQPAVATIPTTDSRRNRRRTAKRIVLVTKVSSSVFLRCVLYLEPNSVQKLLAPEAMRTSGSTPKWLLRARQDTAQGDRRR